jgi:hypothetical protein
VISDKKTHQKTILLQISDLVNEFRTERIVLDYKVVTFNLLQRTFWFGVKVSKQYSDVL